MADAALALHLQPGGWGPESQAFYLVLLILLFNINKVIEGAVSAFMSLVRRHFVGLI